MKHKKYNMGIPDIRKAIIKHFDSNLSKLLMLETLESSDKVFEQLESFVDENFRGISPTQLRKLVDLTQGKEKDRHLLNITRPQFALMIARQKKVEAKFIMLLVDELARLASNDIEDKLLKGFPYFIESYIAYHRFYDTIQLKRMKASELLKEVEKDLADRENKIYPKITDLLTESASNVDSALDTLDRFIQINFKGISSTQLRNIYDRINSAESLKEVKLLKPILVYTAARQARRESIKLIFLFLELIKQAISLGKLKQIVQAVVSIHKYKETYGYLKLKTDHKKHFEHFKHDDLLNVNERYRLFEPIQEALKKFIADNGSGLKSSQFHRLFEPIRAANEGDVDALKWLRPLLLYTAARQRHPKAQNIILFLVELIKNVKDKKQVIGFKNLVEDMISYHRYFDAKVGKQ